MSRNRPNTRRRGKAAGWIVLAVILAVLVAIVSWRMIEKAGKDKGGDNGPTTMPSDE